MNNQTDSELLLAYSDQRSETAFAEIVRRYIDLVYSAALRMSADPHLAQDVTQRTFAALARSAPELSARPVLSGWLHRTAQNIAAESIRAEIRRRAREHQAAAMNTTPDSSDARWEEIAPHLDAAVGELAESDRDAVLLRYFQNKSAREMAALLNITDEGAQKRVTRAVERLRAFFAQRGIALGAAGLAAISANAIQAAPSTLLAISTAAALAAVSGAIATTSIAPNIALQTMNWINAKSIAAAVVAAIAAGGTVYLAQKSEASRLRAENQNLVALQSTLTNDRDDALAFARSLQTQLDRLRKEQAELLRLRAEVSQLRAQTQTAKTPPKLSAAAAQNTNRANLKLAPGTYITKELMTPAGYDTPESALQTMTWSLMYGTYEEANESLSPEILASDPPNESEKEKFQARQPAAAQSFKGMQIVARKEISEGRVELKIKMDTDPLPDEPTQKVPYYIQLMAKVGDTWKLGGSTHSWDENWDKEGNIVPYVK